jgi:two-component system sensor histidine kinase/response regulator
MHSTTNSETATVLIIDDSPTNLGVIVDYLEEGFEIMTARDGEAGFEIARQAQPDLILLDVMMPGIDGFETCMRLKALEATRDIPVIFMTALTDTESKVKGFELGAVDYVTKPLQPKEVLARVSAHLRLRAMARDLQRQAAELQAANQTLARLNADKDKFFSIVAHDLRGPFNPLLTNADLLADGALVFDREAVQQMSGAIYGSAKLILNLLDNLLHWSRLQMGYMVYEPEQLLVAEIVDSNLMLLAEQAQRKEIALQNEVAPELVGYADRYMLNMVVRNLISNAIKFTPPGGQVLISAQPVSCQEGAGQGGWVEVAVADTGVGISPEEQEGLFAIGHRSRAGTAGEEGTGLGLILCREMVKQSGGEIWVESVVGQGTTFRFRVPAGQ